MRVATLSLLALLGTAAVAEPLTSAFDQGTALGRRGNQAARSQLDHQTAPATVPGYTANPTETTYFGSPGLSTTAAVAAQRCAAANGNNTDFSGQPCNAIHFSQANPAHHPSFTIAPTDPLRAGAKTITADPGAIAGNLTGTYSDCKVNSTTQSPVFETEICHQARTMESLACDKVLIVTQVVTPGCSVGQFLTHVKADPCRSCIDYLAYDFTCGSNGYVMHAYTINKDSGHVETELGTQNVPGALNTEIPKTRGPTQIDGFYCFETFYSQTCAGTSCTIGAWFSNPCQGTSNFGANTFVMPTTVSFTDHWDNQCTTLEARAR